MKIEERNSKCKILKVVEGAVGAGEEVAEEATTEEVADEVVEAVKTIGMMMS